MIDAAALKALIKESVREVLREEKVLSDDHELLTTREAGRLAKVSPDTIHQWVTAKHLTRHTTAGGHVRIDKAEMLAFLAREKARKTGAGVTPIEAARLARASRASRRR